MKKITIILFIILLAILGGITYWNFRNSYTKGVLKLEILGPSETTVLQEITYTVRYKNNGNFNLKDAKLSFECPKNSLECSLSDDKKSSGEEDLLRKEVFLGTIYPGQEKTITFKARLLGKKGEIKTAKAWIFYRPKNIKATYQVSTTYSLHINNVPLNFEFDLPSSIGSGKTLDFSINYFSNLNYPLNDITVKTTYPEGFRFTNSQPKAMEKTDFNIQSLNPREGGRIKIRGELQGEIGEQKVFRAVFGVWRNGEFVPLKEIARGVTIAEPSLYISQLINGSPNYAANLGELLHYEIYFRNIGEKPFEKLSLITRLEGDMFDLSSIKTETGENSPGDNAIIWDWTKVPELKFLNPGEEGKVEFWVKLKENYQGPPDKSPVFSNEVTFLGKTKKEFANKINSAISFSQKGYINDPFFNSLGPLPPSPNQKSYFTIVWTGKNSFNALDNVKIKASLAPGVKPTGTTSPATDSFTFDSKSREIIWQIGQLAPYQNFQLAFQVVFISKSQSTEPSLVISPAEISAEDKVTNHTLSATTSAVYTAFSEVKEIDQAIIPYSTSPTSTVE